MLRFASRARAGLLQRVGIALCAAVVFLLAACTPKPLLFQGTRLDATFETEPIGATPSNRPEPTPPDDFFVWGTQFLTTTVVANPAGGRWVSALPKPAFLSDPDHQRTVLLALTDWLTTSPPSALRGYVDIRLDSLGTVGMYFRPIQGGLISSFLGGFEVSNFSFVPGQVDSFNNVVAKPDGTFEPHGVTNLAAYSSGQVIRAYWSINQVSRTFSIRVSGGLSQSFSFPQSITTAPFQRLYLYFWADHPSSDTGVFLGNLCVEEVLPGPVARCSAGF
jgi:hypothetical protein